MKSVKIKFKSIQEISNFVQIVTNENIHAEINSRNTTVSAKTFLGILAMDLTVPLTLMIFEEEERAQAVIQQLNSYLY